MVGATYPVRISTPIPPGARRTLRIGVAVLAGEVAVVGAVLGLLLPLNYALAAGVIVELAFVAAWGAALRHVTRARFGVALPRLDRSR